MLKTLEAEPAGMLELGALVGQIAVHLPPVLVLVVGLILILARGGRLAGRAKALAIAGGGVLLFGVLANAVWLISIPTIISNGGMSLSNFAPISLVVGVLLNICEAIGLGLLIGAVLAGRTQPAGAPPAVVPPAAVPPSVPYQPTGQAPWGPPAQR